MSWRKMLRDVEPYVAGEQPKIENLIKLNTNENPYSPGGVRTGKRAGFCRRWIG